MKPSTSLFKILPIKKFLLFWGRMPRHPRLRALGALLAFLPVVIYFAVIQTYAVNIPFQDDFSLLDVLLSWLNAETWAQRASALFHLHNEHRMAWPWSVFILNYFITGTAGFKLSLLLKNGTLLFLSFVLYKLIPLQQRNIAVFLPIPYLLFHIQHWENAGWSIGSLAQFGYITFAVMSFYFLGLGGRKNNILAILFAVLATYSLAGGLFVFVAAILCLLLARRFREAAIWLGIFGLVAFVYFKGYARPPQHPDPMVALQHPARIFLYASSLLGSIFSPNHLTMAPLAPLGGILLLGSFACFSIKKIWREQFALYGVLVFLLLVVAATGMTRSGFGIHQAFASRYKIVSCVFLILSYLAYLHIIVEKKKRYQWGFSGAVFFLALGLNVLSYDASLARFERHIKVNYVWNMRNWVMGQEGLPLQGVNIDEKILMRSLQTGIYQLPCHEIPLRSQDRKKWCTPTTGPAS